MRGLFVGVLMDLIAGDAREILLAVAVDDWAGLRDHDRFTAYISLGGGMDPTWLDLFAQAAREVSGSNRRGRSATPRVPWTPAPRRCPTGSSSGSIRTGSTPSRCCRTASLDRIAARWIDLIDCEECDVDPDEKPMLRELAGDLVDFCRRAEDAEDVLFAWSI